MERKHFISIFCITICLIGVINCTGTTGKVTTRNTPPRTTGRPTQRTTTTPRYSYCYSCQYQSCPLPFTSYGTYVSRVVSINGWCVKISDSELPSAKASRAIGGSYCSSRGCSWRIVGGVNKYVCCCHGNLCNSAFTNSKSSFLILALSLIMITFTKEYFY